jgi:hypothetical protein
MQENNNNQNVTYDVQVRDAALATAVILAKQPLKSFFTGRPDQQWSDSQQALFNPRLIGFSSETERTAVHKKWAEFRANQSVTSRPAEPQK